MTLENAKTKLEKFDQLQVLKYFDELNDSEKDELLSQIEALDLTPVLSCKNKDELAKKGVISPLRSMELPEIEENREEFLKLGEKALKEGKVGAVLLAGGMGTRLGSDAPKGVYNIGITKEKYIFECLFSNLQDVTKPLGITIPLYIMTSEKNHEATVSFIEEHNFFGYDKNYVKFFRQEMAAATDYEGKVYMESKSRIATSPNGNGGWFESMIKNGLLKDIREKGVEWLNLFAVDNVLQRICDPVFVGATIKSEVAVGAKVVKKNAPDEKVGVVCLEDNKPSIVEYYELTDELMNAKDEKGDPAYYFGVILNYLFNVEKLNEVVENKMPLHIVEKKIPYINEAGELIKPEEPNGYKYENLVLDMIHEMGSILPFEVVREKEFAPIKNATGKDSVESARELLKLNGVEL